jgi:hypothetical protein
LEILKIAAEIIRLEWAGIDLVLGMGLTGRLGATGLHVKGAAPAPDRERFVGIGKAPDERRQLALRGVGGGRESGGCLSLADAPSELRG